MKSHSSGYTLVEAIVVVALTVIVLGIALDALIETDRASTAVSDQLVAAREAQAIARGIEKILHARVGATSQAEKFARDEVQLVCLQPTKLPQRPSEIVDNPEKAELSVAAMPVRIFNDSQAKRVVVEKGREAEKSQTTVLGTASDRYCAEVAFSYANGIKDFTPQWSDSPSTVPQLVKVSVRVWPRLAGMASFEEAKKARFPRYSELEIWTRLP